MESKWIGKSITIWGAIIGFLMTGLPIVGQFFGWDINPADIAQLGEKGTQFLNALGGMIGFVMAFYGRMRAKGPATLT